MRVLIVTTHLNMGGISMYTVNLAKYLEEMDVEVSVASSGGEMVEELESYGIRHIDLDIRTKSEFGPKAMFSIGRIASILRGGKFDLVHAQTRVTQVAAFFASRMTGIPYVCTCHGFFNHKRLSRRLLPAWGDRTIAISRSVKRHLVEDLGVDDAAVDQVYNGIELDRFIVPPDEGPSEVADLSSGAYKVVGSIGRLSPVKGYRYLIEAFSLLKKEHPYSKLLFVGGGPEGTLLKGLAREYGISEMVIFSPGGDPPERYFPLMDIFCLPSLHEGLGLSLMEAMASGKACVASRVGGLVELIDSGKNGILVDPKSPQELAEAIDRMLSDKNLRVRLGDAAKKKAEENFAIEECARRTIGVYEKILQQKRRHSASGKDMV